MQKGIEVLLDSPMTSRAERFMRALAAAAPPHVHRSAHRTGRYTTLVVYGPGAKNRKRYLEVHKALGGRAFFFDMAYWERQNSMRLSLDSLHPTPRQLTELYPGYPRGNFTLRDDSDPDGPILLIGLGIKTVAALDQPALAWERAKLAEIRKRYPGRKIIWRPKGAKPIDLDGLPVSHGTPIEAALRGCSLVVCKHSNVAVDACVAGVPVWCEDGAARAIYTDTVFDPSPAKRLDFLQKLTWWEWSINDTKLAWEWMEAIWIKTRGWQCGST